MDIEDLKGEIIDALWNTIDYINTGPVDKYALEEQIDALLDKLVD